MTNVQVLIVACVLWGCNKKDLQVSNRCNPDKFFKAGFTMSDSYYSGRFADTDTIINFKASFRADSVYTSYKWVVGDHTDTIRTQNFGLHFTEAQLGKTIRVQLIATGSKNPCNPNDDGIDTVNRNLTIMYLKGLSHDDIYPSQTLVKAPYLGKWHGAFEDNPADTFTVLINDNGRLPNGGSLAKFYGFRVYNLPKGPTQKQENPPPVATCDYIDANEDIRKYFGYEISEVGYNSFSVDRDGIGCKPFAEMFGNVDTKLQKIYVSCTIDTNINGVVSKRSRFFVGKKIF